MLLNKVQLSKKRWKTQIIPEADKCFKAIGPAQNAGLKSLNCHLSQTEKDLFFAEIVIQKRETATLAAAEMTEAADKCFKAIGPAQNAGLKSLNCHLSRAETKNFFAEIATEKECKIVQEDFKIYYHLIYLEITKTVLLNTVFVLIYKFFLNPFYIFSCFSINSYNISFIDKQRSVY